MEHIRRANRLYTNDSIYLKKSLSIPVLSDLDAERNCADLLDEDSEDYTGCGSAINGLTASSSDMKQDDSNEKVSDLTPNDFLKRLDGLIKQSKLAAAKGCQEAEKRYCYVNINLSMCINLLLELTLFYYCRTSLIFYILLFENVMSLVKISQLLHIRSFFSWLSISLLFVLLLLLFASNKQSPSSCTYQLLLQMFMHVGDSSLSVA